VMLRTQVHKPYAMMRRTALGATRAGPQPLEE
jgi:hypothetical protein